MIYRRTDNTPTPSGRHYGTVTEAQSAFAALQQAAAQFLAPRTAIWDLLGEGEST